MTRYAVRADRDWTATVRYEGVQPVTMTYTGNPLATITAPSLDSALLTASVPASWWRR